ncbi:hypothetical protein BRADI_4g05520v3 [Brachypodium distachyon]|uniref:Uncharacterized protein n=1 Tax=Brachypodium distachyon TaxID=15368 RepID=A0A2K2CKN9_BRADI|nr:hypothetical protein BRADI_4g05520v3 [Brachypodium distachyon]
MEAENLKPLPPSSGEARKAGGGIPRIWSTDDEALAAHRHAHGALPHPDALMEALAGKLDNRAYDSKELHSKQTALRQRYKKHEEHDRRLYDLSNIVWGGGGKAAAAAAANANANSDGPREFAEMCELYPYLAEEVKELEAEYPGMFKREFGKKDGHKARAMDAKVKRQRLVQMKVELRRGDQDAHGAARLTVIRLATYLALRLRLNADRKKHSFILTVLQHEGLLFLLQSKRGQELAAAAATAWTREEAVSAAARTRGGGDCLLWCGREEAAGQRGGHDGVLSISHPGRGLLVGGTAADRPQPRTGKRRPQECVGAAARFFRAQGMGDEPSGQLGDE